MAVISFASPGWWSFVLAAAVALLVAAGLAWWRAGARTSGAGVGLLLRALGIGLLLVCLLEPQEVSQRAKRGANSLAVVADNSRGLQVIELGATVSRGEQMRAALTGEKAGWLGRLREEFQVRTYRFDQDTRRIADFTELDFRGNATALGGALRDLRERFAGQPLAGIVLFTDGIATDLPAGLPDLSGLPPVYPVMVGTRGRIRDARMERVDVRQTAFDDAPVTLRAQVVANGMSGVRVGMTVRELGLDAAGGGAVATSAESGVPAAQTVTMAADDQPSETTFRWKPVGSGVKFFEVTAEPDAGAAEATQANNRRTVMIDRGRAAYRILYVSGRPSWDYKFFSRALAEDPQLQLMGLIRVARREPKFEFKGRAGEANNPLFRGFGRGEDETVRYDQPVLVRVNARDEFELRGGFPVTAEELFGYDALVIDDLEAEFFTLEQQAMVRRFAAERGGGLLMLGGANALNEGGYRDTTLAAALPVYLDRDTGVAPAGEVKWKLTREGWLSPWVRVAAVEREEEARLAGMPAFRVLNALPSVKPGATVLATVEDGEGRVLPGLVAQNFGAGRVACVTVGDLWRWGAPGEDQRKDLSKWWRQLARWLVTDSLAQVSMRVEPAEAGAGVRLRVTARDRAFRPLDLAVVKIGIRPLNTTAPGAAGAVVVRGEATANGKEKNDSGFSRVELTAEPDGDVPGDFIATFSVREPGAYLAEAEVSDGAAQLVGKAKAGWVQDPAADEFSSLEPNRVLLEELARRTGGRVIGIGELDALAARLPVQAAPLMETDVRPLWNRGPVLLAVLLCLAAEWFWRRRRGLA